ncbi:hypothetical protein Pelo_13200 [Pelomyxa schiedti]|nr:hypothetical protein Pelo_13200 [Pelomyxa schiedti]
MMTHLSSLDDDIELKIMVVGPPAAGKSSLVMKYVHDCWRSTYTRSEGVNVQSMLREIEQQRVIIKLVDVPISELKGPSKKWIFNNYSSVLVVVRSDQAQADIKEWSEICASMSIQVCDRVLLINKADAPFPTFRKTLNKLCVQYGFPKWSFSSIYDKHSICQPIDNIVADAVRNICQHSPPSLTIPEVPSSYLSRVDQDWKERHTVLLQHVADFFGHLRQNLEFLSINSEEVTHLHQLLRSQSEQEQEELLELLRQFEVRPLQEMEFFYENSLVLLSNLSLKWQKAITAELGKIAIYNVKDPMEVGRVRVWPQPNILECTTRTRSVPTKKPMRWYQALGTSRAQTSGSCTLPPPCISSAGDPPLPGSQS